MFANILIDCIAKTVKSYLLYYKIGIISDDLEEIC